LIVVIASAEVTRRTEKKKLDETRNHDLEQPTADQIPSVGYKKHSKNVDSAFLSTYMKAVRMRAM